MATISRTGIQDGLTSKAEHITRIIDALDGTAVTEVVATGSFTGSFTGDGSALTGISAANKINLQFSVTIAGNNLSDNISYYFGNDYRLQTDSASRNSQYVPVTGDIISANVRNTVTGTLGSSEGSVIQIYNATTNVSYSFGNTDPDKLVHNAENNIVAKTFSAGTIPVTTADRIMFKLETPTFSTNPLGVYYWADVVIQES